MNVRVRLSRSAKGEEGCDVEEKEEYEGGGGGVCSFLIPTKESNGQSFPVQANSDCGLLKCCNRQGSIKAY